MPINTYIAGSPPSISTLADRLQTDLATACDDLETSILDRRTALEDHWEGDAADTAVDKIDKPRKGAEELATAAGDVGSALQDYSTALRAAQGLMEDARDIARVGGLTLTERMIEGPPRAPDPSWETDLYVQLAPAQEPVFNEYQEKMTAWNSAVAKSDDAISDLADAIDRLIGDLGDANAALEFLQEYLEGLVPAAIKLPGEKPLPMVERRMREAATRASFFASLSPEQSQILYQNLFMQMESLDDADMLRKLGRASELGGTAADALMLGMKAIERHEQGESANQILLAEGGGFAAGALATGATWAGVGALVGAPATPLGSIALGGFAAVVGTGVGMFTSNKVDDWYEDREFEDMIRRSLEQGAREERPRVGP